MQQLVHLLQGDGQSLSWVLSTCDERLQAQLCELHWTQLMSLLALALVSSNCFAARLPEQQTAHSYLSIQRDRTVKQTNFASSHWSSGAAETVSVSTRA